MKPASSVLSSSVCEAGVGVACAHINTLQSAVLFTKDSARVVRGVTSICIHLQDLLSDFTVLFTMQIFFRQLMCCGVCALPFISLCRIFILKSATQQIGSNTKANDLCIILTFIIIIIILTLTLF
jgi:hypothetical protein